MIFLLLDGSPHALQQRCSSEEDEGAGGRGRAELPRPKGAWAVLQGGWHYSLAAGKQSSETEHLWGKEAEKSDQLSPQFDCCMRHPLPMSPEHIFFSS